MEKLWLKVTNDVYELPLAVARTTEELGEMCGISGASIRQMVSHAKNETRFCPYVKVEIDDNDE